MLIWPENQPRTKKPRRSNFKTSLSVATADLYSQLRISNATNIELSTNVKTRQDGKPYANQSQPTDRGVAVYFRIKSIPYCLACDQWNQVACNVRAIGLHIAALRGQARWGVGTTDQAFAGYRVLPPALLWWDVLGVVNFAPIAAIKAAHRELARKYHPDSPTGDRAMFDRIQEAYEQAIKDRSCDGI